MEEKNLLETNELCDTLDVSRPWLHKNLRHLGIEYHSGSAPFNTKKIIYRQNDVVDYINNNALIMRQTAYYDMRDYIKDEITLDYMHSVIKRLWFPDEQGKQENGMVRAMLYDNLMEELYHNLPEDVYAHIVCKRYMNRNVSSWYKIDYKIDSLSQLSTMNQLLNKKNYKSNEVGYRYLYDNAGIKVNLHGKIWWVEEPRNEYDIVGTPIINEEGIAMYNELNKQSLKRWKEKRGIKE